MTFTWLQLKRICFPPAILHKNYLSPVKNKHVWILDTTALVENGEGRVLNVLNDPHVFYEYQKIIHEDYHKYVDIVMEHTFYKFLKYSRDMTNTCRYH